MLISKLSLFLASRLIVDLTFSRIVSLEYIDKNCDCGGASCKWLIHAQCVVAFLNMKSELCFLLVSITISSTAENLETKYPPVYALDIGDEVSLQLQILRRLTTTNCVIWGPAKNDPNLPLYLRFDASQWRVSQSIGSISPKDRACYVSGENLLFHQVGENPYSEGWYDDRNNISNVKLRLYALEECFTYIGAYVNAKYMYSANIRNGDIASCLRHFPTDPQILTLITASTTSEKTVSSGGSIQESRNLDCRYTQLETLEGGTLELISDENAMILMGDRRCDISSSTIIDISRAFAHNETLKTSGEEFPLEVAIGAGTGAVAVLLVVLLWIGCSGSCVMKNKSEGPGDYGRASVDNNLQYGEGKEYYQYQNSDKKQTRVVDENEMYGEYEQE